MNSAVTHCFRKATRVCMCVCAFLDSNGSDFSTSLAVYIDTNSTLKGLVRIAANDQCISYTSCVVVTPTPGTQYVVQFDGYYQARGDLNVSFVLVASPANDDFANRVVLPTVAHGSIAAVGSTLAATLQAGEPGVGLFESLVSGTVWYAFVASAGGALQVVVTGDGYQPYLVVYVDTNGTLAGLTPVASQWSCQYEYGYQVRTDMHCWFVLGPWIAAFSRVHRW